MKISSLSIIAGLLLAAPALAQQTDPWRMPHERGFWGHTGLSFGVGKLNDICRSGFDCDDKDQVGKFYFGGRFNNAFGLEAGVLHTGRYKTGGGEIDGWGADLALVAGFPIGSNSAIFAKGGGIYSRMDVTGTAPGLATGKERGWGPRFGVGAQLGFTREWALRADWDRYRLALPGGKEDLDTITLGLQYTFR